MKRLLYMIIGILLAILVTVEGCKTDGISVGSTPGSFKICKNGKEHEFSCSDNTVFSPLKKSCILPSQIIRTYELWLNSQGIEFNASCTRPGAMCRNCKQLQICIGNIEQGQETIKPVRVISCKNDEVCQYGRGCQKVALGGLCSYRKFTCSDLGVFPDPYDCTRYHLCGITNNLIVDQSETCSYGSFNAETATCGYPLDSDACINKPVPTCLENFQIGSVGGSFFYVCTAQGDSLAPQLFRCPPTTSFNSTTYSCQ